MDKNEKKNSDLASTVRNKLIAAFGGKLSGEFTDEFLTNTAGLTAEEFRQARRDGVLVRGDHHWVLAEDQGVSSPKSPNAAVTSSLASTVRSKITAAFGGEPSGEFTGEFLAEAGLTEEQIREAKRDGVLVRGDHHWVLAEDQGVSL